MKTSLVTHTIPVLLSAFVGLQGAVIDFETFPGGAPVPFNTQITSQYSSLGVTFVKPAEPTGPRIVTFPFPGRSGINSLAGDDFPAFANFDPIEIYFSMPVSKASVVGLDIGFAGLQLLAFDAVNSLVDSDSFFGIGDGIGHFATLSVTGNGITKLVTSRINPAANPGDAYALDDLTFTAVPEPGFAALLTGLGLAVFGVYRRFRPPLNQSLTMNPLILLEAQSLRAFLLAGATLILAAQANARYAWFARHTDTIAVSGQTVLGRTATYEARFLLPSGHAHGGFVFDELTAGDEDKRLMVAPNQIVGGSFPSIGSSPAKGLLHHPVTVTLDVWHHAAFVTDVLEARLYLDGELIAVMPRSGRIGNGPGPAHVGAIWRGDEGLVMGFVGFLDTVRVSSVARYAGLRFTPPGGDLPSDADTLLLYNFNDDPDSATVHDESPQSRHGTPGAGFPGATAPALASDTASAVHGWFRHILVNPRATYLRVNNDAAFTAVPIDLAHLGIMPGNTIFLQRVGHYNRNIEAANRNAEQWHQLAAVFSRTPILRADDELNRVQDAIPAGSPFATPPTNAGGKPTDIPEDFEVPGAGTWVEVPPEGRYLFVAAVDSQYNDNYDLDADYGLHIGRASLRAGRAGGRMALYWDRGAASVQTSPQLPAAVWSTLPQQAAPPMLIPTTAGSSFYRLAE
jgi:hypothetical protein